MSASPFSVYWAVAFIPPPEDEEEGEPTIFFKTSNANVDYSMADWVNMVGAVSALYFTSQELLGKPMTICNSTSGKICVRYYKSVYYAICVTTTLVKQINCITSQSSSPQQQQKQQQQQRPQEIVIDVEATSNYISQFFLADALSMFISLICYTMYDVLDQYDIEVENLKGKPKKEKLAANSTRKVTDIVLSKIFLYYTPLYSSFIASLMICPSHSAMMRTMPYPPHPGAEALRTLALFKTVEERLPSCLVAQLLLDGSGVILNTGSPDLARFVISSQLVGIVKKVEYENGVKSFDEKIDYIQELVNGAENILSNIKFDDDGDCSSLKSGDDGASTIATRNKCRDVFKDDYIMYGELSHGYMQLHEMLQQDDKKKSQYIPGKYYFVRMNVVRCGPLAHVAILDTSVPMQKSLLSSVCEEIRDRLIIDSARHMVLPPVNIGIENEIAHVTYNKPTLISSPNLANGKTPGRKPKVLSYGIVDSRHASGPELEMLNKVTLRFYSPLTGSPIGVTGQLIDNAGFLRLYPYQVGPETYTPIRSLCRDIIKEKGDAFSLLSKLKAERDANDKENSLPDIIPQDKLISAARNTYLLPGDDIRALDFALDGYNSEFGTEEVVIFSSRIHHVVIDCGVDENAKLCYAPSKDEDIKPFGNIKVPNLVVQFGINQSKENKIDVAKVLKETASQCKTCFNITIP